MVATLLTSNWNWFLALYSDADALLAEPQAARSSFRRWLKQEPAGGLRDPLGLELLSTVHWVVTRMNARDLADVVNKTYGWNERKRRFTPNQLALALDVLAAKQWIGERFRSEDLRQALWVR